MKKRVVTILALTLSASLLFGGCGGETSSDVSQNSSAEGTHESSKAGSTALSEVLGKEKVIGYTVDSVDKSETPDNIYFFDNGKLTIIPGRKFELSMGDFAKMSDDEIWAKYETVKESYKESYLKEKEEELSEAAHKKISDEYMNGQLSGSDTKEKNIERLEEVRSQTKNGAAIEDFADGDEKSKFEDRGSILGVVTFVVDGYCRATGDIDSLYADLGISGDNGFCSDQTDVLLTSSEQNILDTAIEYWKTKYKEEKDKISQSYNSVGPFYDMPFNFVITTDASGNNAQSEMLVYPTMVFSYESNIPRETYNGLKLVTGGIMQTKIYDTEYSCISRLKDSSFLIRQDITMDAVDSKNVLVDLSDSELNELFKDEVSSRYKE